MTTYTHQTAPTQFIEANGIRFAYRRFGKAGGVPIVVNQHFRGTLLRKDRDPEVSEQAATAQREAIGKYIACVESVLDYLQDTISQRWSCKAATTSSCPQ